MARQLDVFLGSAKIGVLEQDDHGALWFGYDPKWLDSGGAVPLSASLPLREERYRSKECRPFFAGLLPEETSRKLVARRFGVSERNDFALLEQIGAECAGAVSLQQTGEMPRAGMASYRRIELGELEEKLRGLPKAPLLAGEEGIRLSLAGAQGKAAVAMRNGAYLLPLDGSPSTHILKPDGERFPGLVENEFFCMRLAAALGLDVAPVDIATAGSIRFLQVARYDRRADGSEGWTRIHQEDFCQALGIPPEIKYQNEGGPGFKECFKLIRGNSTTPVFDVLKLFDAMVFNFLIGNNDAHGKNFSFLYDGGETRLAPLYDLVSTELYPELSLRMAMKVGKEKEAARVLSKQWLAFFEDAELGPTMAIQRMRTLATNARKKSPALIKMAPMASGVASIVERHAAAMLALGWKS
ncbi:MAG: type II toxin-antitoxin system HipA family toxin [Akkermansiaceae bacterium]|nr:type II toxin-antitoxin system HipA family toxin [Akkermansiaceae bacterium]MCF7732028.1 type II toxin-antitoxin system HipA family toxin [Akkermansiaceae bacterium]